MSDYTARELQQSALYEADQIAITLLLTDLDQLPAFNHTLLLNGLIGRCDSLKKALEALRCHCQKRRRALGHQSHVCCAVMQELKG
jgi:hypothetical protein